MIEKETRDLLLIDLKIVRVTFNINNQRVETAAALEVLGSYPITPIGTDFGSVELEFSEEALVRLLRLINLLWDTEGTQIVLEPHVINSRRVPADQAKTQLANAFLKQLFGERRLPVLEHLERYFIAASTNENRQEDRALLTALVGLALCFKERIIYNRGQLRRSSELAREARNYITIARQGWAFSLFQGFCLTLMSFSYGFQGNRTRAQRFLEEARGIYVDIASNLEEVEHLLDL